MKQQYDTLDSIITIQKDCRVYITNRHKHQTYKSGTKFRVISWVDNGCARVVAPGGLIGVIYLGFNQNEEMSNSRSQLFIQN